MAKDVWYLGEGFRVVYQGRLVPKGLFLQGKGALSVETPVPPE
jgi:hypothetical protein